MSPLNINQPLGITGLLDGYYFWWCPIFLKWESYQSLVVFRDFCRVSKWCSHQVPCAGLPQPFPHPGNTATAQRPLAAFRRCHHHGGCMACWFTNWTKATSVSGSPEDIPKWKHLELDGNKENYVNLQYITSLTIVNRVNSVLNDIKLQITNDICNIQRLWL